MYILSFLKMDNFNTENKDIEYFLKNKTLVKLDKTQEAINTLNNSKVISYVLLHFPTFFVQNEEKVRQNKNIMFYLLHNTNIKFTSEQKKCLIKMMHFIKNYNCFSFGLYGFAGTGKTTLLIEFVAYLLQHKYITSVVFSAPTNKAVNVMKSKFHPSLEKLVQMYLNTSSPLNFSFDDKLEFLEQRGIKLHFMTMHKLLMYQTDFTSSGEVVFNRINKNISLLDDYQLAIIDECSMIGTDMAIALLNEAAKKTTKVIFAGDPAQLPPVNEDKSIIFDKTAASSFLLTKVMRTHLDNVIDVWTKFRSWKDCNDVPNVNNNINKEGFFVYNNEEHKDKLCSTWFKLFTTKIKNKENAVILTWTNKATDTYNLAVRQQIFGTKLLKKYEKNDILILADFYNLGAQKIYTSEQIIVKTMENTEVPLGKFERFTLKRCKTLKKIEDKISLLINGLNEKFCENVTFTSWILNVEKFEDKEQATLLVVDDIDVEKYNKAKNESSDIIRNFIKRLMKNLSLQKQIEHHIAQPLWKQWHRIFINPFANVNYGYSITCHKAQGSNMFDVFVDFDDILQNGKFTEAQKCAYTAITRASNELHLLA